MYTIGYTFLVLLCRTSSTWADTDPVPAGCWPENIIPFKLSHGFNDSQISKIREVIGEFHRYTCIRWADNEKFPYDTKEHVVFKKVEQSYICHTQKTFRSNGGEITVVQLGDSCFEKRILMHEMLHVLGFNHEHQRADRDCYVYVDFQSAPVPISEDEIAIKPERWLERFPYDKYSNTHYPRTVLIKVKLKKKYAKEPPNYSDEPLGNDSGELTFLDTWKILYKFCGFVHYCDVFPPICVFMDETESTCIKPPQNISANLG